MTTSREDLVEGLKARGSVEHELKCWTESYDGVDSGAKPFEYRRNDRDYRVNDVLWLREWNPHSLYTGRSLRRRVTWLLTDGFGLAPGYCVMGLQSLSAAKGESGDVADVYPGWRGITQPCDVCGRPVAVNAISPSECSCSQECGERLLGIASPSPTSSESVSVDAPQPIDGETAWLIEEVWSGYVHYVHKGFNCADWAAECRRDDARRKCGLHALMRAPFITKNVDEAKHFPTKEDAELWQAMQPQWLRTEQFQIREHIWPSESVSVGGDGWLPIESAPRDGTKIDVWVHWPEGNQSCREPNAWWNVEAEAWQLGRYPACQFIYPSTVVTRWRPLPAAPGDPS